MLKSSQIVGKLGIRFFAILLIALAAVCLAACFFLNPGTAVWILLLAALALAAGSFAARLLVKRLLEKPLQELTRGMNDLAEKRFDTRLDEDRKDEFGELAVAFNDTASIFSASMAELTKTRDYLRGILESSADIIISANPSGRIQTVNMGAEKTLGFPRNEVVGKALETFFVDREEGTAVLDKLRHTDNVVNHETQFHTRDGVVRNVLLTLSRLRNQSGAIIGTIGIGKDITEEKNLQRKLIQSQRLAAIGEVFTGIQHTLKNMLNALKGGAFMVKTGLARDNRQMFEEGWDMVQQGISSMTEMSLNMLNYVKEWKPKIDWVDLGPTLAEIDHVVRQTAKDRGVAFSVQVPPGLPSVLCDLQMIRTAVMDILSNALDACDWKDYPADKKPEVTVRASVNEESNEAVIEVKDNGCGMTKDVIANIFTPFFSTKSRAGTGLGLAITSRIISVHGGRIDVESEPNLGATFRIVLPVEGAGRKKENIDGKEGPGGG